MEQRVLMWEGATVTPTGGLVRETRQANFDGGCGGE